MRKQIMLINGPNLDMLGTREPEIYGTDTLDTLQNTVRAYARSRGVEVRCFQSNHEGKLIRLIHSAQRGVIGVVYNPGAHTHYSYALRDAVASIDTPVVEVHLSAVNEREAFRHVSVIAPACVAQVKGLGVEGYCRAIDILLDNPGLPRLGEGYEADFPADATITMRYGTGGSDLAGNADAITLVGSAAAAELTDDDSSTEAEDGLPFVEKPDETGVDKAVVSLMRTAKLHEECAREGIDLMCVRDTSNIHWLTAFDGVFDEERAHCLAITPNRAVLHTDSRYATACEGAAEGGGIEVDASVRSHMALVVEMLRELGGELAVGIEGDAASKAGAANSEAPVVGAEGSEVPVMGIEDDLTLAEYRLLEKQFAEQRATGTVQETKGLVKKLRAVKDAVEIGRLLAAQAITDAAFDHIVKFMKPGMAEREVQIELEDFMVRQGAEGLAFPSIVACGANAAAPHAIPGETVLQEGQCVVLDFGAKAYGYCSDMTRTVFLGQPDDELQRAYAAIRDANEQVEAMLRPGVTGIEAHKLAEDVLAAHGFGGKMGHGLGHGVGLDIHEEPCLNTRNDAPLEVGNVVTVEPGIYLPGKFGMRLEDFGVITEDGFKVFTRSTHEMVII